MLVLRQLEEGDKQAFLDYIKSWKDEAIVPSILKPSKYQDFHQLVQSLMNETTNSKKVLNTTLILFDHNTIVGAVNIRHHLNEKLKERGGHIGYGVSPKYRRKGYATYLLDSGLQFLKTKGIQEALITCDQNNEGSKKVIESFEVIEREAAEVLGTSIYRYYISTKVER